MARIKAVKSAAGVTVNDVVLAMSSGAPRAYLIDQNSLPDDPLTTTVPVNLRKSDDDRRGNMVGTFLCHLATDVDDPAKRLEIISTSIRETKEVFQQLPRLSSWRCRRSTSASRMSRSVPPSRCTGAVRV